MPVHSHNPAVVTTVVKHTPTHPSSKALSCFVGRAKLPEYSMAAWDCVPAKSLPHQLQLLSTQHAHISSSAAHLPGSCWQQQRSSLLLPASHTHEAVAAAPPRSLDLAPAINKPGTPHQTRSWASTVLHARNNGRSSSCLNLANSSRADAQHAQGRTHISSAKRS